MCKCFRTFHIYTCRVHNLQLYLCTRIKLHFCKYLSLILQVDVKEILLYEYVNKLTYLLTHFNAVTMFPANEPNQQLSRNNNISNYFLSESTDATSTFAFLYTIPHGWYLPYHCRARLFFLRPKSDLFYFKRRAAVRTPCYTNNCNKSILKYS